MPDHAHNLRARSWNTDGLVGVPTRGTTNHNRLRKSDRWTHAQPHIRRLLTHHPTPTAIDVGYGNSHTTTVEWAHWLRRINPRTRVIGLEIDPARVLPPRDGVIFAQGGFELAGHTAHLVRAFNVLRQYDAAEVSSAWQLMAGGLREGGVVVEGTCDELGRRATWVTIPRPAPGEAAKPSTLTFAWDPHDVERPSDLAERLPKVLIHHNTPGTAIHTVLRDMDRAWDLAASYAVYGPRVRWRFARSFLSDANPQLLALNPRRRTSDSVLTVPWSMVAPD